MKNRVRKSISIILCLVIVLVLSACKSNEKNKYTGTFLNTFDTSVSVIGYFSSQEEFDAFLKKTEERFTKYHRLFDIYNNYEGINNIKTINDNAAKKEIVVDQSIIDLLKFSKEMYEKTDGKANIAMGSLLEVWHSYREKYASDESGKLPSKEELEQAAKHIDINSIILNEEKKTVFINDKDTRIDVGACAKGFATEKVVKELKDLGYTNFIISAGGNIKIEGAPLEKDKSKWGVGVQNPYFLDDKTQTESLDVLYLDKGSVVSSGDYERFYTVSGKRYSHIIDKDTLYPAENFSQVTVVTENSALADFMSTALFLSGYEDGLKLAEKMNVEVIWAYKDKTVKTTKGIETALKSKGASSK